MIKAESDFRTVSRICSILNSFNNDKAVLTLTEISRRINLPKSTTCRFLQALEGEGMVYSDPGCKGYRLGFQLIHWGTMAQDSIDLREDALPILRHLTETTGESSILSMRFGNVGTWVEIVESRHLLRLAMQVGRSFPLYAGASSKVLLAFLSDPEIERILGGIEFKPIKKNTITDLENLCEELRLTRARGYAVSFEEIDVGAMGIAAPVYDHAGQLAAGIGILAPITRVPEVRVPEMVSFIMEASHELSKRLGA
ncbi:MAG: IclR family transcriptional regulator [Anaerolineaceae bacterium]|nr:IclR family transcriptional regulator [Anaerolineaceae bacterium]